MLKSILACYLPPNTENKDKYFNALNCLIPILTGIYIFANPQPASSINEICYYLACAVLMLLLICRKTDFTLRSPLTLPLVLFSAWAVFGLLFALDFKNSLHDLRKHLLEYLIVFYLLVNYFNSQKRLEIISVIVIASATLFSIGAIIQYYFIEGFPFSSRLGDTFTGAMPTDLIGFITIFASILALHLFNKNKTLTYKILFVICFLITVITTILTQSRGSFIGLCVPFIILCFANKKNIIFVLAVVLMVVFMPGMKDRIKQQGFTDVRTKINRLSLEIIKEYPITGIGFSMQTYGNQDLVPLEKYNRHLPTEHRQSSIIVSAPHNMFLDIAIRTGIIGLILFLYILLTAVWLLWRIFKLNKNEYFRSWVIYLFAGFMSFLIQSLFADATFGPRAVFFHTILAMITILSCLAQKTTQPSPVL